MCSRGVMTIPQLRLTAFALLLCGVPVSARAHVRVFPDAQNVAAPACSFTTFVVRVPVEKNVPTDRIDLTIPKGVVVFGVQPKPGWQFTEQKTRGVVTGISWSGRLMPGEFDEFLFLAATPKVPGKIVWDARQHYEDGSVVSWTGGPNAETPHSVTSITPARCRSVNINVRHG
jgi:uncharacterized protein YcnI